MGLTLKDFQSIPNTVQPTAGQGLTLDFNGLLPPGVFASTPTDLYALVWDDTLKRPKWAQITSAGITDGTIVNADVSASAALGISKLAGYPTDATKFLRGDGTWAVVTSVGQEQAYNEFTSDVTISATTEGTANTVVTASSFTADGTSAYYVEFFAPRATTPISGNVDDAMLFWLYQDGSSIGEIGELDRNTATGLDPHVFTAINLRRRLVPASGSRTYSIRASLSNNNGTPKVNAGAGGSGAFVPGFIRITKVT